MFIESPSDVSTVSPAKSSLLVNNSSQQLQSRLALVTLVNQPVTLPLVGTRLTPFDLFDLAGLPKVSPPWWLFQSRSTRSQPGSVHDSFTIVPTGKTTDMLIEHILGYRRHSFPQCRRCSSLHGGDCNVRTTEAPHLFTKSPM